jgi:glycosyltransferase involved in cell wall biosynthesis
MFFNVIGAASAAIPGGGVDLSEYAAENAKQHRKAFLARHMSTKPFVLVLGRKAGAKNYRLAIDAVLAVNRDAHRLDLVLIGPDDDGVDIRSVNVYYYGAQERDVVLGALSLAMCLVNMSESESFGIVLLESWLSGKPVVAQRACMAFAELVVSGENGFLVETRAEIAEALEHYLARPDVAEQHARRGMALAGSYSWENIAVQIEALLLGAARSTSMRRPAAGASVERTG